MALAAGPFWRCDVSADLVQRLRDLAAWAPDDDPDEGFALAAEAATEVERLRGLLMAVLMANCGPDCAAVRCGHVSPKECDGCEELVDRAWAAATSEAER